MYRLQKISLVITLVIAVIFAIPRLQQKSALNWLALAANRQETRISTSLISTAVARSSQENHGLWLAGLISQSAGDLANRDVYWMQSVQNNDQIVIFLHQKYPEDLSLAVNTLKARSDSSEAWFWLGDLQPDNRLLYYQKGLELAPADGQHWLIYGDILQEKGEIQLAMQAYLQSCLHGDPGVNGCLRAGGMAEKLGDLDLAIQYYRLSNYTGALERASQLEEKLKH